jgi:hypothetical protein
MLIEGTLAILVSVMLHLEEYARHFYIKQAPTAHAHVHAPEHTPAATTSTSSSAEDEAV